MKFGSYSVIKTIFELGISILLVVYIGMNFEGRIYGILVTGILFSIVSIYILKRENLFKGSPKKKFQKEALNFGLPLIPHAIGAIIINLSDRIFISKMVSIDELGIYNIGYTVGSIILIIDLAFNQAWSPHFYQQLKEGEKVNKQRIVKQSFLYILVLLIILMLLTIAAPILYRYFIHDSFSSSIEYVFWIGLGYVFLGCYKLFAGYIFYLKQTKILGALSVLNVALNLFLNYQLIKLYGALGAAYATAISFSILFIIVCFISTRKYTMPWSETIKSIFVK